MNGVAAIQGRRHMRWREIFAENLFGCSDQSPVIDSITHLSQLHSYLQTT